MPRVNFVGGSSVDFSLVNANNDIFGLHAVGDLLYCSGDFTTVTDASGTVSRGGLACLNLATGLWTSFDGGFVPFTQGKPAALTDDGMYLYAVGAFEHPGSGIFNVMRFNMATGAADTWEPWTNPVVFANFRSVRYINGALYIIGPSAMTFAAGTRNYVAKFVSDALTAFAVADAGAIAWNTITGYVADVILAATNKLAFLGGRANPVTPTTAFGIAFANETTGLAEQMPDGFATSFGPTTNGAGGFGGELSGVTGSSCSVLLGGVIYGARGPPGPRGP